MTKEIRQRCPVPRLVSKMIDSDMRELCEDISVKTSGNHAHANEELEDMRLNRMLTCYDAFEDRHEVRGNKVQLSGMS